MENPVPFANPPPGAQNLPQKILDLMNMETVHVAWDFFKENGLKALIVK